MYTMEISQHTWRALGMSVSGGYCLLGALGILFPHAAAVLLVGPVPQAAGTPRPIPSPAERAAFIRADRANDNFIPNVMPLLGARDLSIGLALALLGRADRWREVGIVTLAGLVLCAADVVTVYKRRGAAW